MDKKLIYLKDKKLICDNTLAIRFEKRGLEYNFTPGLYTQITLLEPVYNDEEGNTRFFSIANSPDKDYFMFTTRNLPSAFNKNILELPIGSPATIADPGGNTPLHSDSSIPGVFLIGGIGITPVRCIVEYVTENKLNYELTLFYSNPDAGSMPFLDEFEKWQDENPLFKLVPTIDDTNNKNWKYNFGYINEEMIKKNISDVSKPIYYIVGPPQMVDGMLAILKKMNVAEENIKFEKF